MSCKMTSRIQDVTVLGPVAGRGSDWVKMIVGPILSPVVLTQAEPQENEPLFVGHGLVLQHRTLNSQVPGFVTEKLIGPEHVVVSTNLASPH